MLFQNTRNTFELMEPQLLCLNGPVWCLDGRHAAGLCVQVVSVVSCCFRVRICGGLSATGAVLITADVFLGLVVYRRSRGSQGGRPG